MIKEDSKYTGEELATGKNLFASSCQFMLGVANLEQLPPDNILDEIAFAGRSNVGKSSLINLIPRFYDVSTGVVFVNGVNVKDISLKNLRDLVGYVPQKSVLFSGTVRSNMLAAKPDATDEEIIKALEIAQAKSFVLEKEEGLDAPVSQGGTNFSGGQRQRLAIARAVMKMAPIYIFDDSFSALDFTTDLNLRKAL